MAPASATPRHRKKAAVATLDEMLALYDDDEEAWFARAQAGPTAAERRRAVLQGPAAASTRCTPAANHELVHFYEGIRRPALGWPLRRGVHGVVAGHPARLPHAGPPGHADRQVGHRRPTARQAPSRWRSEYHSDRASGRSEDHQFSHHLETLTAVADPRRPVPRGPRDQGGGRGLQVHASRSRGSACTWPSATGTTALEDRRALPQEPTRRTAPATWRRWSISARATPDRAAAGGRGAPAGLRRPSKRQAGSKRGCGRRRACCCARRATATAGPEAAGQGGGEDQERLQPPRLGRRGVLHGGVGRRGPARGQARRGRGGVPGGAGPRRRQRPRRPWGCRWCASARAGPRRPSRYRRAGPAHAGACAGPASPPPSWAICGEASAATGTAVQGGAKGLARLAAAGVCWMTFKSNSRSRSSAGSRIF